MSAADVLMTAPQWYYAPAPVAPRAPIELLVSLRLVNELSRQRFARHYSRHQPKHRPVSGSYCAESCMCARCTIFDADRAPSLPVVPGRVVTGEPARSGAIPPASDRVLEQS